MIGYTPVNIATVSNETAGTYYYPSTSGISLERHIWWGFNILCQDATLSVEITSDRTNWLDTTWNCEDLATRGWLGGPVAFAAGAPILAMWFQWLMPGEYARLKAVFPNGTNDLTADFFRRWSAV